MMFTKNAGVVPTHIDVLLPEEVDAEGLADIEDRFGNGRLIARWYSVKY